MTLLRVPSHKLSCEMKKNPKLFSSGNAHFLSNKEKHQQREQVIFVHQNRAIKNAMLDALIGDV